MLRLKFLVFALSLAVSINAFSAAGSDDVLATARCAQDLADYSHGGLAGIEAAAGFLTRMRQEPETVSQIRQECRDYLRTNGKRKISRARQLKALDELRGQLSPEVYFFLRGAIRPLIACHRSGIGLYRFCRSATGKTWFETGHHPHARGNKVIYRLGHSEVAHGILVIGPQDEFTLEDQAYVESLPQDFAHGARESLPRELSARYFRVKVFMGKRTTRFMRHYFLTHD